MWCKQGSFVCKKDTVLIDSYWNWTKPKENGDGWDKDDGSVFARFLGDRYHPVLCSLLWIKYLENIKVQGNMLGQLSEKLRKKIFLGPIKICKMAHPLRYSSKKPLKSLESLGPFSQSGSHKLKRGKHVVFHIHHIHVCKNLSFKKSSYQWQLYF